MKLEQTALPITEDHSTIYLSVEVSRSSWVIGVYCPATDENIRTHKIKAAETQELYALALKAQHRAGMPTSLMLAFEAGYEGLCRILHKPSYADKFIMPTNHRK